MTTTSFLVGMGGAVVLFWAIGAFNRLVRLRSEVVKAFSALDNVLSVQPALIQASLPASLIPLVDAVPSQLDAMDGATAEWLRLHAAGEQFARSLARARARPLDPEALSALSAAQSVLDGVWQRGAPAAEPGVGGVLPEGLQSRLAHLADQAVVPAGGFDLAVQAYNAAIRQFPALVLARVWGFKAAGTFWPRNLE